MQARACQYLLNYLIGNLIFILIEKTSDRGAKSAARSFPGHAAHQRFSDRKNAR